MNHFAKTTPVNSLIALFQPGIHQFFHLCLDILKSSEELMASGDKRRLDIRKNTSKAESLSVRLKARSIWHLVRKITC